MTIFFRTPGVEWPRIGRRFLIKNEHSCFAGRIQAHRAGVFFYAK